MLISDSLEREIFFELRLPRLLLGFFAGATLSLGGLILQNLFRNDLMSPYTLGISSGAILGTAIAVASGLNSTILLFDIPSIFGFLGAMTSSLLLLFLAKGRIDEGNRVLLLGIALSFFYSAALMAIYFISSSETVHEIILYTLGNLSVVGYKGVYLSAFGAVVLLVAIYLKRYALQIFGSSALNAKQKGIDTSNLLLQMLLVSALSIGIVVSITGPIGFVGLVVPHLVKGVYKRDITSIILPTFFYGGLFMVLCDTLARALSFESDLPIGVITSFIGGAFFLYLLVRSRV